MNECVKCGNDAMKSSRYCNQCQRVFNQRSKQRRLAKAAERSVASAEAERLTEDLAFALNRARVTQGVEQVAWFDSLDREIRAAVTLLNRMGDWEPKVD